MPRRLVIAGLAAAFSLPAFAAFAQTQPSVAPIPVSPQPAESQVNQNLGTNVQQREQRVRQGGAPQDTQSQARQTQGSAPAQTGQQQSQADRQYVEQTLAAGTVSLQATNFALGKAQNPRVKQFAGFEAAEQNTMTDVLHGFAEPAATSSTGQTSQGARQAASTAPVLPQDGADAMEAMSK